MMDKWQANFLGLAANVATWSQDPSTKVGAVIVDENNRVVSVGYNGFPKGIKDDGRLNDRVLKYQMILHAETNAVLFANNSVRGCTIYTWPFMPCSNCASLLIQSGIKKVVSVPSTEKRWESNFNIAKGMFEEAGISLEIINLV